ncbi:hypothetical protein [Streptomyces sp. NPDC005752]
MTATTGNDTPVAIRPDEAEPRRREIGGDLATTEFDRVIVHITYQG